MSYCSRWNNKKAKGFDKKIISDAEMDIPAKTEKNINVCALRTERYSFEGNAGS